MKEEHDRVKKHLRTIANKYLKDLDSTLAAGSAMLEKEQVDSVEDMTSFEAMQDDRENQLDAEEGEKKGDGLNYREHEFEGQDELFQSIRIPDDMSIDNDYLDEISRDLSMPLDMKDDQ